MLFDTHAHINDEQFDEDRSEIISSLKKNGVEMYCEIGFDIQSSAAALDLANKYDFIYCAAGVHPDGVSELGYNDMDKLKLLLKNKKAVALGEIGLDYYYENSDREIQKKWFDRQLSLAEELNVPVTVHTRDAMGDTIDILKCHKGCRGIIHCFSGKRESAKILLDMGYYISFAGPVTFKNANKLLETAAFVPDDRILIETDSPYMAPVPFRGKRNNPVFVAEIAKKLSEIRNTTYEHICDITFNNAKNVYRIK